MRKFLAKWHSRLGIIATCFAILLAVTGIALNHTEQLQLHQTYIDSEWLLNWYDINPESSPVTFKTEEDWVTQIDNRLYLNKTEVAENIEVLHGAINIDGMVLAAIDNHLQLFTREGITVEKLAGAEGVPAGLQKIGFTQNKSIVMQGAHGIYQVDLAALRWQEHEVIEAIWSTQSEMPGELYQSLLRSYRGKGLNLERVMLDLHSGRILGQLGVYLVDAVALFLIILAISGSWLWLKGR